MSEYTNQRLRWMIDDYKGSGATTRDEANLAQLVLDYQCHINYRRLTLKKLKSLLHSTKENKLISESHGVENPYGFLAGYTQGIETAIELFRYYAKMADKESELESS